MEVSSVGGILKLSDIDKYHSRDRPQGHFAPDKTITYGELFETCNEFEEDEEAYDEAWLTARKSVDWKNLGSLPLEEIESKVIFFLNQWACHLPAERRLAERIRAAHNDSLPFLNVLEGENIQDFDFEETNQVEGNKYRNSEVMLKVLDNFISVGYNFRDVAASKVLHMVNPHLFVMWDTNIAEKYIVQKSAQGYVYNFIPMMKRKANGVINSYVEDKICTREQAVKALNDFKPNKTLAKLLDEYNYMKCTREL